MDGMAENGSTATRQFLTFALGGEQFALETCLVSEVVQMTTITRIPRVPSFLRGVINLRGNAATIVDLKIKFDLGETQRTQDSCIIIVEREYDGEKLAIGLLADSVHEVLEFAAADILETPDMGASIDAGFIDGVARVGDLFIMILRPDRLFALDELAARRE